MVMKKILCLISALAIVFTGTGAVFADTDAAGIKLSDLETYSEEEISCMDSADSNYVETNYKEDITDGATLYSKAGFSSPGRVTYFLDGEYAVLSGTLYVPYESREQDAISTFRIYGDDRLLYDGPSLTGKDKPVDFAVNTEGVEFLEIIFTSGWYKGDGSGSIPAMCAGNLVLSRENSRGIEKNTDLPVKYLSEEEQYSYNNLYGYGGLNGVFDLEHDGFGTAYPQVNCQGYNGIIANSDSEDSYVEYYLAGAYKCLTGTAYVPAASTTAEGLSVVGSPSMNIYVDDQLAQQIVLSGKDKPVQFNVNIENADFLRIEMTGGGYKGDGTGMVPLMCAANMALYD